VGRRRVQKGRKKEKRTINWREKLKRARTPPTKPTNSRKKQPHHVLLNYCKREDRTWVEKKGTKRIEEGILNGIIG